MYRTMYCPKYCQWALLILLCIGAAAEAAERPLAETTIERRLRFTMTIENPTTRTLSAQRVLMYAPVKETSHQRLVGVEVDVPHRVIHDEVGNTIIELQFERFPAYGIRVVTWSALVRMRAEPQKRALKRPAAFLQPERFIEADLPAVQRLAGELAGARPVDTARSIYDWLTHNLHYAGFVAPDLGAAYALRERRGDCTEYAYLATALSRASGLPARVLGGYVTTTDVAPRPADYHNWAEIYYDKAWHLLDAQKGHFRDHGADYVAMRVISSDSPLLGEHHRFKVLGELVARME